MTEGDEHAAAGLLAQLAEWRAALDGGAARVGWKIGLNVPAVQRQLGLSEPVVGHLTSASRLEPGGTYAAGDASALRLEPEVAVELGRDVDPEADARTARAAISALATAIELVDVGQPAPDLEGIVAGNVFHRAFATAASHADARADGLEATVTVNGERRAAAAVPADFADVVGVVARRLGAAGERLRAGDLIIAGSLTEQLPVEPEDRVTVEIGPLGRVDVAITA